jgi:NAD(P)-dependent dehydrogenase (short-subunit alcohol dehydrogenase family)
MPDDDGRQPWALILGASSGFGEAVGLALAELGYDSAGFPRDRGLGLAQGADITARIAAHGRVAHFANANAADDERRGEFLAGLRERFREQEAATGRRPYVRVILHSLAFGTLKPFLTPEPDAGINRRNMEMTLDVMAHSLVYWAQDVWRAGFLDRGSKIYAMTSEGSTRVIESYGAVSAAKCALESHCRQLAMEFARLGSGVTVNAIRAGVTLTHALMQIPERDKLVDHALTRNPSGRMTTTSDVATAILRLSESGTDWITGNVIGVDGGELITG